ncbi:hypothetical protein C5167_039328 [Papaver somniferum]|uniref:Uncharacterized protein n=1 Tax=Papaver somniferum TaxID=3469 RepID=A0A4Y7IBS5_PAPSO|nr:uncharacterized protein LOC113305416 [Papaver somniferum]RZC46377.1 hypothetical protein C5167_039328 [Papaver somniferum]
MGDLRKEETMVVGGGGEGENGEKDEKFLDGMAVMDFDMLCATVALQTEGGFYSSKGNNWGKLNNDDDGDDIDGGEFSGGVQRMWEGDVFDCLEDRRIALQTACCPCYRFGKNMGRAGLGHCFIQGTVYFILVITTLFSYITFTITRRHLFLYLALAFTVSAGTYFGYCRRQIRKQFNIRGSDSSLDDCLYHLTFPCCTLCQESRTLEINNVQNGIWRGRGDTFCVGSQGSNAFLELHRPSLVQTKFPDHCSMQRASTDADHSWSIGVPHAEPLVPPTQL